MNCTIALPAVKSYSISVSRCSTSVSVTGGFRLIELLGILMLGVSFALQAQPVTNTQQNSASTAFGQDFMWGKSPTDRFRIGFAAEYAYVAPASTKYEGVTGEKSGAKTISAGLYTQVPIDRHWFIPLRLGSQNLFLVLAGLTLSSNFFATFHRISFCLE